MIVPAVEEGHLNRTTAEPVRRPGRSRSGPLSELHGATGRVPGPAAAAPSDVAFVQLSSGSTGRQKAIPIAHAAVRNLITARNGALRLTNRDVIVSWLPLYHDLGLIGGVLAPLQAGVKSVLLSPFHWLAKPATLMRAIYGQALPERSVGEVVIRSNTIFAGYLRDPALTAETLRDGWLHTGDLGYMVDGNLYICGRQKDVMVVGGVCIYAEDVESAAARTSGVRRGRVAAFGVQDQDSGTERMTVLCELDRRSDVDPLNAKQELRGHVKRDVDAVPATVAIVPAGWILKTTSGKVARRENRAKRLAQGGVEPAAASRTRTEHDECRSGSWEGA